MTNDLKKLLDEDPMKFIEMWISDPVTMSRYVDELIPEPIEEYWGEGRELMRKFVKQLDNPESVKPEEKITLDDFLDDTVY